MGFIQIPDAPSVFPECRVARPRPRLLGGIWFFRVAELADLLGVRVSGGFMAALREAAADGDLRLGEGAAQLRDGRDTPRTAFVSAACAERAIRRGGRWASRCMGGHAARVADALGRYAQEAQHQGA